MSFGEQRMAGEGRCGTCHVCFERMSVLLQDDDGAAGNRVRRSFPDRAHRHLQGARRAFLSGSRALLDRMAGPSKTSTRPAALADPRHQLRRSLGDIKRGHDSRELLSFAGVQRIPSWIVKPRAMPVSAARGEGIFAAGGQDSATMSVGNPGAPRGRSRTGRAILREISRPPKLGRVLLGWVFFDFRDGAKPLVSPIRCGCAGTAS